MEIHGNGHIPWRHADKRSRVSIVPIVQALHLAGPEILQFLRSGPRQTWCSAIDSRLPAGVWKGICVSSEKAAGLIGIGCPVAQENDGKLRGLLWPDAPPGLLVRPFSGSLFVHESFREFKADRRFLSGEFHSSSAVYP